MSWRRERPLLRPHSPEFLYTGPPTEPVPLQDKLRYTPYRDPRLGSAPEQDSSTRQSLELAVRAGELMMRCGASTRDVESSVIAVAAAAGLRRLEVDITNQALLIQAPAPTGPPISMLRVVRSGARDFARLAAVHRFVADIVRDGIGDIDETSRRLREIQRAKRLYPGWMRTVAYCLMAGSVCALLGGGTAAIAVAVLSTACVDQVDRLLSKRDLPSFFIGAAGSFVATMLAWAAYVGAAKGLGGQMSRADFAFAVAAGIVILLPGRAMASAVEDGISGYPVTGAGRLFAVLLTCAAITVGVAVGLSVTLRLDHVLDLGFTSPQALKFGDATASLGMRIGGGGFGALCAAVTMRSELRQLLPTALLGAFGSGLSYVLALHVGLGGTTAVAIAAATVGILGRIFALRLGAPALVLVVPAVSPLLPGLRIFRGIYDAVSGTVVGAAAAPTSGGAIATMIGAAGVALAISTGLILGDALAAPLDRRSVRLRRARRR